ncbi:hypothetical protein ACFL2M_00645 [Patescibacteria group bacterium]
MATALVIVLDAVGLSTLHYLLENYNGHVEIPNLARLGLGRLLPRDRWDQFGKPRPDKVYGSLNQASASADSVVGHREMVGIIDHRTYDLFPTGFPQEYIAALEQAIGHKTMYNSMGGGTQVVREHGHQCAMSGRPIVYSSKCDPLIQIAADKAAIPLEEQHQIAEIALKLALKMGIRINRAIARPFYRTADGSYERDDVGRHDAVLPIAGPTLVELLRERDIWTTAVGKVSDLVTVKFDDVLKGRNSAWLDPRLDLQFADPDKRDTNPYNVQWIFNALSAARYFYRPNGTFIFANLVDTDTIFGHTRDIEGALRSLMAFDRALPFLQRQLTRRDLLIITADHGMEHRSDYGYHSLEPLPLLAERIGGNVDMPDSPADLTMVGAIVARFFGCQDEFQGGITHIRA